MDNSPSRVIRHRKIFEKSIEQIEDILYWVSQYALQNQFTKKETIQLEIAVEEAAANIIEHARTKEAIEIALAIYQDRIEVQLLDEGEPFNPLGEERTFCADCALEDMPVGGLGILLMKKLVSSIHYERKGGKNILSLIKYKSAQS